MAFAVFFLASRLLNTLFIRMEKTLSLTENTFVFMIILVININWDWIVYEEMDRVNITEDGLNYTAFLLFRSIIIPMVLPFP
ncbi:hypothetical protein [Salibacterium aidingense]|uniref:hypothetical protein n=1 Tax=Salibacterium aidingense TaxID=384933 RepID=UPI0003FC34D9|nr:hypothetical protein [Salibacterium aidingense]